MGLIQDLRALSNPAAFEWAEWKGRRIKVEVRSAWGRSRGTASGNVIADEGHITISTRYVYPYGINDEILFRGKRFVITDISGDNYEITPQSTVWVRPELSQEITLTLFEVGQMTRNLRVPTPVITSDGTNITISVDYVQDASIYYETPNEQGIVSPPSSRSTKYTGSFSASGVSAVYAIAIKPGYEPSAVGVWKDDGTTGSNEN